MAAKRSVLSFTIDPELRERCKALAAQQGKTLGQWAQEAMNEKLERELPNPSGVAHVQFQPAKGSLKDFLDLSEKLLPVIRRGTLGKMDAAADIDAMREERLRDITGI